jgi:hypothetical protein
MKVRWVSRVWGSQDASPRTFDADSVFGKGLDSPWQQFVFVAQYASVEGLHCVVLMDINAFLKQDWPGVQVRGYQVHGAAGYSDAVVQRLSYRMHGPGKRRKQWGMGVYDSARPGRNEFRQQDLVEASEHHKINSCFVQGLEEHVLTLAPLRNYRTVGQTRLDIGFARPKEAWCGGAIAAN